MKEEPEGAVSATTWLSDNFKPSDVNKMPALSEYEKRLYWISIDAKDTIPLEKQKYAYPDPDDKSKNFADCGATSLKNFFKLILDKNGKTIKGSAEGDYDTRILDNLAAHQDVKYFFTQYNTRASQKTQEARNAWGRITCEKEIKYRTSVFSNKPDCEIDAGRKNMLALINKLLFTTPATEKITSWEELASKIQAARKAVWGDDGDFSFRYWQKDGDSDDFGTLPISVKGFSNGFNWKFQTGHFFIEPLPKGAIVDFEGKEAIKETGLNAQKALNIYSLYPTTEEKLTFLNSLSSKSVYHSVFRTLKMKLIESSKYAHFYSKI